MSDQLSALRDEPPRPESSWDFRDFVRERLAWLRQRDGAVSLRHLNQKAGFRGAGFLSMVLAKKRNLSTTGARRLGEALNLSGTDLSYFIKLAAFNQCRDLATKDRLYNELLRIKRAEPTHQLELVQYEFFNHWYYAAVFELLIDPLPDRALAKAAKTLGISLSQAEECLRHLEQLGLARLDKRQWRRTKAVIQGASPHKTLHLRAYHRAMIQRALAAVDAVPVKERELSGVTLALSAEKFKELRELIFKFQEKINAGFSDDPQSDKIYQVNMQLFPLADYLKREDR